MLMDGRDRDRLPSRPRLNDVPQHLEHFSRQGEALPLGPVNIVDGSADDAVRRVQLHACTLNLASATVGHLTAAFEMWA